MGTSGKLGMSRWALRGTSLALLVIGEWSILSAQEPPAPPTPPPSTNQASPSLQASQVATALPVPTTLTEDRPLPINLATALKLANVRPIDVALASKRVEIAQAQLDRASVLWLPSIYAGVNYARHDGRIQDILGFVIPTNRSSFMAGIGPSMVFAVSDAIFAPLSARQVLRAREAEVQVALNDTMVAVADAYFTVQQARGEAAGAVDAVRRAEDTVHRARQLAEGLVPRIEVNRAETELARRRQAAELAREKWETSAAELARILRLPPSALLVPLEAPHLTIELVSPHAPVDDLITMGLSSRPELARDQAQVQASYQRLRQERTRPLLPTVMVRGNATNPSGTLSTGTFGGGIDNHVTNFGARNSIDVQLLWELRNLGCGDLAAIHEKRAQNEEALLELVRTQDRVAAEVVRAHAEVRRAANRIVEAESGLVNARETAEKNVEGMGQTRRIGEFNTLVFRPQEVVASIQALDQAYRDYFGSIADFNRAQFRLYRALGQPAQILAQLEAERARALCPPAQPAPASSIAPPDGSSTLPPPQPIQHVPPKD